jgi:hypothetical protein
MGMYKAFGFGWEYFLKSNILKGDKLLHLGAQVCGFYTGA